MSVKDCFAGAAVNPPAIGCPPPLIVDVMRTLWPIKGDWRLGGFKLGVTGIVDRRIEVTCGVISVDNIDNEVSRYMANCACAKRRFKRLEDFGAAVHLHIHGN